MICFPRFRSFVGCWAGSEGVVAKFVDNSYTNMHFLYCHLACSWPNSTKKGQFVWLCEAVYAVTVREILVQRGMSVTRGGSQRKNGVGTDNMTGRQVQILETTQQDSSRPSDIRRRCLGQVDEIWKQGWTFRSNMLCEGCLARCTSRQQHLETAISDRDEGVDSYTLMKSR